MTAEGEMVGIMAILPPGIFYDIKQVPEPMKLRKVIREALEAQVKDLDYIK